MNAKTIASLLLVFSMFTLNDCFASHGEGEDGSQEQEFHDQDEDGPDDGEIDGSESLEAKIILVATADAPAGAKGCAKLEAENEDGSLVTTLKVKTTGLIPGDYILSAVRKSDGSSVALGQITLGSCSGDDQENEDNDIDEDKVQQVSSTGHNEDGDDNGDDGDVDGDGGNHHGSGHGCASESEVELPPDLDPMDIAQIILSDTAETALLVGDFVDPVPATTIKYKARIHLTPDNGAPGSEGTAQVLSTAKKGKKKDRFTMVASNVPANSSFDVQVNGANVGTVKSNKKGKVLVKKLPANLLKVRSVHLKDSQGNTVAKAKF